MSTTIVKFLIISLLFGLVVSQIPRRERPKNREGPTQRTTTKASVADDDDDDDTTGDCPGDGFFADADQCDKYYACYGGEIAEKLCPDGMVFNDYDINVEKCDLPYNIDCSKRSKLQEPQPSHHCPRKNGYFGHEQANVCDKFYYCVDGQANMYTCPAGLVFNPRTGICTWADEAGRGGCSSEEVFQFTCPKVNETIAVTHPRYADPEDCQYFYVCINGAEPRKNGCKLGQVFNDATKSCDWPRNVPECADFYKDRLTDEQLEELENPKTTTARPKKTKGPVASRRRPSRPPPRKIEVEEEVEDEE
ncbi:hypothetical protein PVAND_012025 [Polypedilum vanderplanki]|uniref:Chitin-binding type-2 domain-containing protein n=1 Tax=Polypedilum vanderplanki TaxID=319348 RepID=A0A9J6CKC3_POLVA|nr:hypothetical protein PVAND_012025 [Polypedilum vanderplanki]